MEADTIHAAIEKIRKNTTVNIDIPRDWANLIRSIPRKHNKIFVYEMNLRDFLDFKVMLSGKFQHTKTNTFGEKVGWSGIREIMYSPNSLGEIHYRNSFQEDFKTINLLRKKTRRSAVTKLTPISNIPLGIPANKLQHLRDLMPYVDEASRPYYMQFLNTIAVSTSISRTDPNMLESEDESPEEENV